MRIQESSHLEDTPPKIQGLGFSMLQALLSDN